MMDTQGNARTLRAVGYARVSTRRQAEHEVSLDEQQHKILAYCTLKDAQVIEQFVERGLTGRTDKRPEFQRMVAYVCDPTNAIDLVVVYSFSRFFRNVAQYLHYKHLLKEAGVRLVSATQDIPEGPQWRAHGNHSRRVRRPSERGQRHAGEGRDDGQRRERLLERFEAALWLLWLPPVMQDVFDPIGV